MSIADWEIVIGLEVHVQLKTRTKLFCGCLNKYGADPNTLVCPICLGLPGVLPVLNRQAFALAVRAGVALGCEVAGVTKFDRKNYYYPDLPKGYQISQYDRPLNSKGRLEVDTASGKKNIGITRIHLEEDAGKLIHPESEGSEGVSFVDLNRAGVPLAEIVSEPDMRSPDEAYAYLTGLKEILQYVDISDCDMEKGSLRCDANVSIRKPGDPELGVKTEIKNLNSFKAVAKALQYEAERHAGLLEKGEKVKQVTLTWDAVAEKTVVLRSKEEAHDYRYFPEPDLVHIQADPAFVERIRQALPERPAARRERYVAELGLPPYDAGVLTADKNLAALFDALRAEGLAPKVASNWVMGHVLAAMNEKKLGAEIFAGKARRIAEVAKKVEAKEITGQTGGEIFLWILDTPETASVEEHIRKQGLAQVSDTGALEAVVKGVIEKNAKIVADYRSGKASAVQALVGQVMRETKGKANASVAKDLLVAALGSGAPPVPPVPPAVPALAPPAATPHPAVPVVAPAAPPAPVRPDPFTMTFTPAAPEPAVPAAPSLEAEYLALARSLPVDAPDAVDRYLEFRDRAKAAGETRIASYCSIDLGAAFAAAGDSRFAQIEFQRVVALGASAGDDRLVGSGKDSLGILAQREGRLDDAARLHQEALVALRKAGKGLPLSRCLNNLGLVRVQKEDFEGAIEAFREARGLRLAVGDRPGLARIEANLGLACLVLGRYAEAEKPFRAAILIMDELPAVFSGNAVDLLGTVCANLAVCVAAAGHHEEAISLGRRAAGIFAERSDEKSLADVRHNIGCSYLQSGDFAAATAEFNRAAERSASAGERLLSGQSIFNIAVAQARAGAATDAKRACQAASAEFEHLADADGMNRTQAFFGALPRATEQEQRELIEGLAYGVRTRRYFQAAGLTG